MRSTTTPLYALCGSRSDGGDCLKTLRSIPKIMKQQDTLFDKVILKIKNNRVVAILMAIGIIIITLSTFTDAVKNLLNSITASHITAEAARIKLGQMSLAYTPEVFISSAEKGDLEAVKLFLTAGMNSNVTDTEECTALIHAVRGENILLIDLLIKAGVDVNKKGIYDMTALSWAASRGNKKIAEILLDNGADPDSMNQAFLKAASHGHLDVLRLLLDRGVKIDQIKSQALLEATHPAHPIRDDILTEVINFLLSLGADVNIKDEIGWTPLLHAVLGNSEPAILRTLLASGADVNARCECPGYSDGGWSALMLAAQDQSSEIIKILLSTGADINARNNKEQTALILAAQDQNSETIEILLGAGAAINARDNEGRTALIKAAEFGNMGAVQVLIDKEADVNIQDNNGQTALAWAVYRDHVDIVHALIKRQREVNP